METRHDRFADGERRRAWAATTSAGAWAARRRRPSCDAALDAGITLFDTADIYGGAKSEEYLGAALGARRDEVVLATKFGAPYEGHEGGASPAYIRTAVEDSLNRLGTDRIDLYQQHVPDRKTPIAETLGVLGELVAEGKVREIGCSNFSASLLQEAAGAVHRRRSRLRQRAEPIQHPVPGARGRGPGRVRPTGTAFLPYFPLAMGLLSGKYRSGEPPPEGTRISLMGERAAGQLTDERLATVAALDELAHRSGHTVLDLAFAWLLSRSPVASVIAGATTPAQIVANVAAGGWRPGDDVLAEVDAIAPRTG